MRLGRPTEAHIIARRIGHLAVGLYASAVYLEEAEPVRPGLRGHTVIAGGSRPLGIPEESWFPALAAEAGVALRSGSTPVQLAAAVAGLGIAAVPCYLADAEPALRRVLPAERLLRDIWLATRRDLHRAARIRAVAAWVAESIKRSALLLRGDRAAG